jgi:hypothetical protein
VDANLSVGFMARLASVGIGERLDLVRADFARAEGRQPDGIVLLDRSGLIELMDAGATRLLDLDPRRELGNAWGEREFDGVHLVIGEGAIAIYEFGVISVEPMIERRPSMNVLEELLRLDSLEDVMTWLGDYFDDQSDGFRGAIALRDEASMVLWAAWPLDQGILMPLRFSVTESRAYRTGQRSYGREFELVSGDDVTVVPVVVDGSVMGLVAWEGSQGAVDEFLPHFGMVLGRFME